MGAIKGKGMSGKYNVILADPAWQTKAGPPIGKYKRVDGKQLFERAENKTRELAYPSMSIENICKLPVNELCNKDAHLYLWVTNQYLLQAQSVIAAWGFKYSTTLVWAKKPFGGGLGGSYRITTEFLLFATRGSLKAKTHHVGTWFDLKRPYKNGYPCHSKKPPFFHELIEKVSPGPYLEMFAREQRPGWDVWGNEVENSIQFGYQHRKEGE